MSTYTKDAMEQVSQDQNEYVPTTDTSVFQHIHTGKFSFRVKEGMFLGSFDTIAEAEDSYLARLVKTPLPDLIKEAQGLLKDLMGTEDADFMEHLGRLLSPPEPVVITAAEKIQKQSELLEQMFEMCDVGHQNNLESFPTKESAINILGASMLVAKFGKDTDALVEALAKGTLTSSTLAAATEHLLELIDHTSFREQADGTWLWNEASSMSLIESVQSFWDHIADENLVDDTTVKMELAPFAADALQEVLEKLLKAGHADALPQLVIKIARAHNQDKSLEIDTHIDAIGYLMEYIIDCCAIQRQLPITKETSWSTDAEAEVIAELVNTLG